MWGQEKRVETRSREQEGKEAVMVTAHSPVNEETGDISAFLGKGVEFKGTISYSGTVKIDGHLDGEILTDGILLIGEEAVIQAKITAGTIVCKGRITGDIVAKECVKLRAPAVIKGTITTPILSMEDGVLFNGALHMSGIRDIPEDIPENDSLLPIGVITPPNIKRVSG
jgi:cytoskeletal protein CcmA (bactofilin family)